jgi:hypothetical protein
MLEKGILFSELWYYAAIKRDNFPGRLAMAIKKVYDRSKVINQRHTCPKRSQG